MYIDTVFGFYGVFCLFGWVFFNCLVGCFSMIVWTHAGLSVLYAMYLYFCICPCSAQLSMSHMERCSRNTLIFINIIIVSSPEHLAKISQHTLHIRCTGCPIVHHGQELHDPWNSHGQATLLGSILQVMGKVHWGQCLFKKKKRKKKDQYCILKVI